MSAPSQPGGGDTPATGPALAHAQEPHPSPSAQSLAECADAWHFPSAVSLKEVEARISPEDVVVEELPVQLMFAPDDKASDKDDMTTHRTLSTITTSSTSTTSGTLQEHDLHHKPVRDLCSAVWQMSSGTPHLPLTHSEGRRRPRSVWKVASLQPRLAALSSLLPQDSRREEQKLMRPLCISQYHLSAPYSTSDHIPLARVRDLQRPP